MISAGVVLIVAMTLFGARIWGLSQNFQAFDHPFVKTLPIVGVRVGTITDARAVRSEIPDVVLWLDVRATADGKLIVLRTADVEALLTEKNLGDRWKGPVLSRHTLEELRPVFPEAPLLEDLLREFPDQRVVLNVVDNVTDVDKRVIEIAEPLGAGKRALIQSDANLILKAIKDRKAMWLYGTGWPDLMRLLSFESLWLLPAAPFTGDVFVAPMTMAGRPAFNDAILAEMKRRKKTVLLGPLETADEVRAARDEAADGLIVGNPGLIPFLRLDR